MQFSLFPAQPFQGFKGNAGHFFNSNNTQGDHREHIHSHQQKAEQHFLPDREEHSAGPLRVLYSMQGLSQLYYYLRGCHDPA